VKISLVCPHVEHAHTGETSSLEALKICLESAGVACRIVIPPLGPALAGHEDAFKKFRRIRSILKGLACEPDPPDLYHIFLPSSALSWILPPRLPAHSLITYEGLLIGEEWRTLIRLLSKAPMYAAVRLLINNSLIARLGRRRWPMTVASEYQKRELIALGYKPSSIHVLPNIVRPNFFDFPLDREQCLDRLGLDPSRRHVTYLGHFLPSKGVETLIEAFDGIVRSFSDVDLVLAWSGVGEGRDIERRIAEKGMCHRVKVLGSLDPRVVLRASHLAVFPYRTIHGQALLPSVILESLAVGTPAIVPAHPIFSALDGLLHLVPKATPLSIEKTISEILNERRTVRRGPSLEKAFRERMNPDVLADQTLRLYESIVRS
jgi:glycosyltransferase involved in cell wall biosynthesis